MYWPTSKKMKQFLEYMVKNSVFCVKGNGGKGVNVNYINYYKYKLYKGQLNFR